MGQFEVRVRVRVYYSSCSTYISGVFLATCYYALTPRGRDETIRDVGAGGEGRDPALMSLQSPTKRQLVPLPSKVHVHDSGASDLLGSVDGWKDAE
jgi:hypothetical protein